MKILSATLLTLSLLVPCGGCHRDYDTRPCPADMTGPATVTDLDPAADMTLVTVPADLSVTPPGSDLAASPIDMTVSPPPFDLLPLPEPRPDLNGVVFDFSRPPGPDLSWSPDLSRPGDPQDLSMMADMTPACPACSDVDCAMDEASAGAQLLKTLKTCHSMSQCGGGAHAPSHTKQEPICYCKAVQP